jgi:hypothetical protein
MQTRRGSWSEEVNGVTTRGERRALEYPEAEAPYRDQPDIENVEDNDRLLASRAVPESSRDDSNQWIERRASEGI